MPTKSLFVLSPCGTSLLTNQADNTERMLVSKYANFKDAKDVPTEDRTILEDLIKRVEEKVISADLELASRMSAELNGIIKLYQGKFNSNHDEHNLLCTDTWLGETTAKLVEYWLKSRVNIVNINRQKHLQTKDIESFQTALSEIVSWSQDTIPGYRQGGYHVVFNLTGGFKSVQGFLQTLAAFYADETIYIFETSKDLLRIPRLPIEMVADKAVYDNLTAFRRLSMDLPITTTANIPEMLLLKMGDMVDLSAWGELIWKQTKEQIYSQGLQPSPSEKLKYGGNFEKSLQGLSADRLVLINTRIDQLAKCLEEGKEKYNPNSLDFKQLEKDPCPPSTHEIDAWSDGGAYRMFGYYDGSCFILDKFRKHL